MWTNRRGRRRIWFGGLNASETGRTKDRKIEHGCRTNQSLICGTTRTITDYIEQIPGSVYRKDWVMYIGRTRNRTETRLSCKGIRSLSNSIRISTRSGKTNPGYVCCSKESLNHLQIEWQVLLSLSRRRTDHYDWRLTIDTSILLQLNVNIRCLLFKMF